jgi:predicted metal-binding membrane protein
MLPLVRCRVPATALASGWRADRRAVIRFGIGQGIACFGCCWALMAVMFAVGIMNVVWIAILGAIMVEKPSSRAAFQPSASCGPKAG